MASSDSIGLHQRDSHSGTNPLVAAIYGALLALVIGCACSYVLTRSGLGIVGARGDRVSGPGVFARSALNLYALQHISLDGVGGVIDATGTRRKLTASIALPLTVWAVIPIVSLMIGGYSAARSRAPAGRRAMTGAAIAAGILYAVALAAASRSIHARLDTFLMPEVGGFSANPPEIAFHPSLRSALAFGLLFGVVFSYLGALIAVRKRGRERLPAKWWACGKAVVVVAAVVQLLLAVAVLGFALPRRSADTGPGPRIVEMLPTAAGIGCAMIHGATLVSTVESRIIYQKGVHRAFYAEANTYTGVKQQNGQKPSSPAIWIGSLLVGALAAFMAGWLAVGWGSRDGSLLTGSRVALLHTAYVALLPVLCGLSLAQADPVSSSTILVQARTGLPIVLSFVGVFMFSLIGADLADRRRIRTAVV